MDEESLFAAALEQPSAAQRQAYLSEACAGDTALRRRLERLLALDEATAGILDRGQDAAALLGAYQPPPPVAAGAFAGRFELREKLGEGGMGEVWVADQTEPVKRRVALKVIRPGFASARLLARFEQERQTLALMDHPNIGKVLDAGTADGRPFFVMELIDGQTITRHCDEAELSLRQRLELFVPVCQAVQHAHTKGVIHRDLKPANVLVTRYDAGAVPKVIDFGIAKAVGVRPDGPAASTEVGMLVGTLEYMSPEQAEASDGDLDTRSDVYALGVLLYELLTGSVPFSRQHLQSVPLTEMLRLIKEAEPPRPSVRLESAENLVAVAVARRTEPKRLVALVHGELDWVVMKCLDKDRDRRYQTASALAVDVQRYLADEVVEARPPSASYRLRKLVRRNRGRVAAATALTLSLLVGLVAVLAVQTQANRDRAAAQTERVARSARATAGVAAALREADERSREAWSLIDHADRMQAATAAALAALRRADDAVAGGSPDEATLAELEFARAAVNDLDRHTRLVADFATNQQRLADDLNGQTLFTAWAAASRRHGDALRAFGLDAVNGPVDDVARSIAESRVRDVLLGLLLEWQTHAGSLAEWEADDAAPAVRERLGTVARAARRLSGGPYARWQELLDRRDFRGLVAFAVAPDALTFRPALSLAFARNLMAVNQFPACRQFLRAAIDRHPHDVWLHFELATTCMIVQPPDYHEALRHLSAANSLRPDSAILHLQLGACYAALGPTDLALAAYRKSIALFPELASAYEGMGFALSKKNDRDGARAAFETAQRLRARHASSSHPLLLAQALTVRGRYVEAYQKALDGLRQSPKWAENPRKLHRYFATCLAVKCADGLGIDPAPPAERAAYRQQALDLLTAELAALRKMTAERAFVHRTMQVWLTDNDLASVRLPDAVMRLPAEERDAWQKLWANVRDLRDRSAPPMSAPHSVK